jgi:membrane fusion protein, multidrug efflux system
VTAGKTVILVVVALIAFGAASVRSCTGCNRTEPRAAAHAPAVPTEPAPRGPDEYVGVIAARRTAVVSVDFESRVLEVLTSLGDRVSAGDPIARLDDAPLRQELAAARAVAEAKRTAHSSDFDLNEARQRLGLERHSDGEEPPNPVPSQDTAQTREIERRLAATLVAAPISGVISSVRVTAGDAVEPGAALLRISDPTQLSVRFAVPPEHAARVRAGTRVVLSITGTTVVIPATVRQVAAQLEPPVRLLLVEAEFTDPTESAALLARLPTQAGAIGRVRVAPDQG